MKEVDQRVIETIEKVRKYVEADGFQSAEFPLENVSTLIDITMGSVFWKSLTKPFVKFPNYIMMDLRKRWKRGIMRKSFICSSYLSIVTVRCRLC